MLVRSAVLVLSYGIILALSHTTRSSLKTTQIRQCPNSGILYTEESVTSSDGTAQKVCYACMCRFLEVTAVCVQQDCSNHIYEEEQEEQKRIAEKIVENLTNEDGVLKHGKCVPFVSGYSDCTPENACTGCTRCECDENAVWTCRQHTSCPQTTTLGGPLHIEYFTTPIEEMSEENQIIVKRETNLENKIDLIDNNIADTGEPPCTTADITKDKPMNYFAYTHIEHPVPHEDSKYVNVIPMSTTPITTVEASSINESNKEIIVLFPKNESKLSNYTLGEKDLYSNSSNVNQNISRQLETNIFPEAKEIELRKWSETNKNVSINKDALNISKYIKTLNTENTTEETFILTTISPKSDKNNKRFNGKPKFKGHRKFKQKNRLNEKLATKSFKTNRPLKKGKKLQRKNVTSSDIASSFNVTESNVKTNKTVIHAHNYANLMVGLQSRLDSRIDESRLSKQYHRPLRNFSEHLSPTSSKNTDSELSKISNKREKTQTSEEVTNKYIQFMLDNRKFFKREKYVNYKMLKKEFCKASKSCNLKSEESTNQANLQIKLRKLRGQMFDTLMTIEDIKRAFKEESAMRKLPKRKILNKKYARPYKKIWEKLWQHYLNTTSPEKEPNFQQFQIKFLEKMGAFLNVFKQIINFLSNNIQNDATEDGIKRKERSLKRHFGFKPTVANFDPIRKRQRKGEKIKKLKKLLYDFKIIHNRFLKNIVDSVNNIEEQDIDVHSKKTLPRHNDKTEIVTKDILMRLKILSGLVKNNKFRSKRSILCGDSAAMEYLLTIMELFLKENQNTSEDAIDVLIDAFEKAPPMEQFSTSRSHNENLESNELRLSSQNFMDNLSNDNTAATNLIDMYPMNIPVAGVNETSSNDSPDFEDYDQTKHTFKQTITELPSTKNIILTPVTQKATSLVDQHPIETGQPRNKHLLGTDSSKTIQDFDETLIENRRKNYFSSSKQGADSFNLQSEQPPETDTLVYDLFKVSPEISWMPTDSLQDTKTIDKVSLENMKTLATIPSDDKQSEQIRKTYVTEEDMTESNVNIERHSNTVNTKTTKDLIFYSPDYDLDTVEGIDMHARPPVKKQYNNENEKNRPKSKSSKTNKYGKNRPKSKSSKINENEKNIPKSSKNNFYDEDITEKNQDQFYYTDNDVMTLAAIETTTDEDLRYKDPISRFFNENEIVGDTVLTKDPTTVTENSTKQKESTEIEQKIYSYTPKNVGYHYNPQGFLVGPDLGKELEAKSLNTTVVLKSKEADFLNSLDYGEPENTDNDEEPASTMELQKIKEAEQSPLYFF